MRSQLKSENRYSQNSDSPIPLKLPPQNLDAERAVLGSILIDPDSLSHVVDLLRAEDFYHEGHRLMFGAMLKLSEKNEPTDILTVSHVLETQNQLESVGGVSTVAALADQIPSSANIVAYAKIVREKSVARRLLDTAADIATKVYEDGKQDSSSLVDYAEKKIFDISEHQLKNHFAPIRDIVKASFKQIESLFEQKREITGLPTGFKDFDSMTSGLQRSDLIILAARPSMGKTALCLNIAENAALLGQAKIALFSLEMSKESLVTRMLCSQARIDSSKLRRGLLDDRDWPMLTKAAGHLSEIQIYIDDSAALSIMEMRAKCRRLAREKKGLDLIIVDYLQLMRPSMPTNSREQEISEISRGLKALAKELNVPVIALSQLNRAVENRQNKRPMCSDLRESGAIEQDADIICFIYRDEVYDPQTPDKGVAELIIGKQRNGPTGTCRLSFLNQYTRFEDLAFNPNAEGPASWGEPDPF